MYCRSSIAAGWFGRVDAKAHRAEGRFEVKALYLEEGVVADEPLIEAIAEAIQQCANWHATPDVEMTRTAPRAAEKVVRACAAPARRRLRRLPAPRAPRKIRVVTRRERCDDEPWIEIVARLVLSVVVGGAIGLNRDLHHKQAGVRTNALVSLGAALAILVVRAAGHR